MVAQVSSTMQQAQRATPGKGYDGVVKVSSPRSYGTGALLSDGLHVLTARHVVDGQENSTAIKVTFETAAGQVDIPVVAAIGSPTWRADTLQEDYIVLELAHSAPLSAERYQICRDSDDIGQVFTFVGYGKPGLGSTGYQATLPMTRAYAENRFDGELSGLKALAQSAMDWTPPTGTQLYADFDDGTAAHDAAGAWLGRSDLGTGNNEGMITPGDSGGPAFINGQIAGIASMTFSLPKNGVIYDTDSVPNSSFGEIGVWQRISAFQQPIDTILRQSWKDAPKTPAEVQTQVQEGNSDTHLAYFLLQFTGMRSATQKLSVDYATRDGTAKAGEDYLATRGTLVIYPNEEHAVIAVEILGDTVPEGNETFYLDVTNPVGGSFGRGIATLTAMRTILNDDGLVKMVGVAEGLYGAG